MEDLTILFTDIVGSTRLVDQLGDGRWLDLIHQHNDIVRAHLRAHGGREVKSQGDGFMLAFTDSAAALHCARAVQRSMSYVGRQHAIGPFELRIGADRGSVARDGNDYLGLHVNLAARITGAAHGAEILASSAVREHAGIDTGLRWGRSRALRVRGLARPVRVSTLEWSHSRRPRCADLAAGQTLHLPEAVRAVVADDSSVGELTRLAGTA